MTANSISFVKGTPIYMSPEIWFHSDYSKASDVYAFSIILYEIITNIKPFKNFNFFNIPLKVKEGYRPEFTKEIPQSYKDLIISCWNRDPLKRPTFDEIVEKLRNDKKFITNSINEEEFSKFVHFIDNYEVTFGSSDINIFNREKINEFQNFDIKTDIQKLDLKLYLAKVKLYPFKKFTKLDENSRNLILEAENDPQKQFQIGKYIISGEILFPQNSKLGIQYLKRSIKSGNFDSLIYYDKLLIKGQIIPKKFRKS